MEVVNLLYQLLLDPNVAYVLLVLGLWALVAAVTTPGTGVAEVAAAVFLVLAAVGLLQLDTNLVAVVLIVLAVGLFVIDLQVTNHGAFTLGAIVAMLLGSLFLFRDEQGFLPGGGLNLFLVIGTIVASAGYFAVALYMGVSMRKLPPRSGAQTVVGAQGIAKSRIDATSGTAQVAGELWSALADGEPIETGDPLIVTYLDGLKVHVRRPAPVDR
jgi:membrane-bound serine protease (ClpP class)